MQEKDRKTVWRCGGLIAVMLPISLVFPLIWIPILALAWVIYDNLRPPIYPTVPPPVTWRTVTPDDGNWLSLFCDGCESPAEEQFLRAMVTRFDLKPANGVLKSPRLTLEMQVAVNQYRYDFVANGRQIIEIDGAAYHSSPEQLERDRVRDELSARLGYQVLRIPATVVFNAPAEAVRRVEVALEETSTVTVPQRPEPLIEKRTISQHASAFAESLEKFERRVSVSIQTKEATADFRFAIDAEKSTIEMLVGLVESDLAIERELAGMSPEARKNFDALSAELATATEGDLPLEDICKWRNIAAPAPVNDADVQREAVAAYDAAMEKRAARLSALRGRCEKDPLFASCLREKMTKTRCPLELYVKIFSVIPSIVRTN